MKPDNATIDEGDYDSSSSDIRTFSKSSSGLSGGAIAGIVIVCVVALIALALAIILLRKPQNTKHLDNTTVSGLKTVENLSGILNRILWFDNFCIYKFSFI